MRRWRILFKRLRRKSWTIKVVPQSATSVFIFKISSFAAIAIGLTVFLFLNLGMFMLYQKEREEKVYFQSLHAMNLLQRDKIARVQRERQEMGRILSVETERLENRLTVLHKEDNELRKIIGLKKKAGQEEAVERKSQRKSTEREGKNRQQLSFRYGVKNSRGSSPSVAALRQRMQALERAAYFRHESFQEVKFAAILRKEKIEREAKRLAEVFESIPSIWPVTGYISSSFGYRIHPISGGGEYHQGLDIVAAFGTPIRATAAGVVVCAGWEGGFGYTIKVDHGNGLVTQYSHCSQLAAGHGARVSKGDVVAYVGTTGYSTGPHLHYQMFKQGALTNPAPYLDLKLYEMAKVEAGIHN
ncbi:MAG: M23 family metallopeptidase [Armatimonadetes bacterium]|nr:M23 family metallopeptidase [Armatimonadota bacterium]